MSAGSLLLATVYLGEALILIGNMYCGFYVSRMRVSLHFSSADLSCITQDPPLCFSFPHPLCKQQVPSSEMLSVQGGRWLMERTAQGFYPFGPGNGAGRLVQHLSSLPLPCLSPRGGGGKSVGGGRSCGPQMCELLPTRNSEPRTHSSSQLRAIASGLRH